MVRRGGPLPLMRGDMHRPADTAREYGRSCGGVEWGEKAEMGRRGGGGGVAGGSSGAVGERSICLLSVFSILSSTCLNKDVIIKFLMNNPCRTMGKTPADYVPQPHRVKYQSTLTETE